MRMRMALLAARLRRARSRLGRLRLRARRFLFVAPHLQLADPSIAADFVAGQIVLGGRSLLTAGRSPLDMTLPGAAFALAFHGFEWLRHFEANGAPQIRSQARALVAQWMDRREAGTLPEAEAPRAVARRVIHWTTHSVLLTEQVDLVEYRRLLDHLARDAAMLRVIARRSRLGMIRLEAAIAYAFQALALDHDRGAIAEAETIVLAALREAFAADGTPRDRSAGTAVELSADLIALFALYRARQRALPDALSSALIGLISFIRMMQQPDGGLALFNGAGRVTRDLVGQVMQSGMGTSPRIERAPDAGFERLEDGHALLIADAGVLPAAMFGLDAGAGALAFEFSTRADRLIVNCGMPQGAEGEVRASFRKAVAHSTVLVDDEPLARLTNDHHPLFGAVQTLTSPSASQPARYDEGPEGPTLVLSHEGLRATTGAGVERRFTLLADGQGLAGCDRFTFDPAPQGEAGSEPREVEARRVTLAFHLHPRVVPVPLSRRDAVVLRLPHQTPGRDMWLFEAPGIALQLEASRCFEQDFTTPQTEAIVIDVMISGSTDIIWRLTPYHG